MESIESVEWGKMGKDRSKMEPSISSTGVCILALLVKVARCIRCLSMILCPFLLSRVLCRGKAGLNNLGNTCFLNSAVQCLSHVQPLTRHILTDAFLVDVNTTNPLGEQSC